MGPLGSTFSCNSGVVDRLTETDRRSPPASSRANFVPSDRCKSGRVGSIPRRPSSERNVVPGRNSTPHFHFRVESSPQIPTSFSPTGAGKSHTPDVRQCNSSRLHQKRRGHTLHSSLQTNKRTPLVVLNSPDQPETFLPPGTPELSSRSPVPVITSSGDRMDSAHCSVPQDPPDVPRDRCGPFCHQTDNTTEKICEPLPGPSGMGSGCNVHGMDEHHSLCISSIQINSGGSKETPPVIHPIVSDSSPVAEPVVVPRNPGTTVRSASPDPSVAQTVAATPGASVSPQPPNAPSTRVATIRSRLRQDGFSRSVARYAAASQRQSSLRLYQSHWRVFSNWCTERDVDPGQASVHQIADFLVYLHEVKSYAPSTIANYRTSIASTLGSVDGVPLSLHPCLSKLIKAFASARPTTRPRVPEWDLSRVLRMLRSTDFEPPRWDTRQDKMRCTWKTVLLLALATSSRRSELQALSRDPRDLVFSSTSMSMRVVPGFLAKTAIPGMDPAPFTIPALEPFSGRDGDDRLLCPVRMVKKYLKFTGGLVPKERLFKKVRGEGHPSSQTVAAWIKACVRFAHQHRPDLHVSAHEVRRMSASWAFHGGAHSVDDILQAGTWATTSTFTSFYLADVRLQPDGRFRMQPIVARKQLVRF